MKILDDVLVLVLLAFFGDSFSTATAGTSSHLHLRDPSTSASLTSMSS